MMGKNHAKQGICGVALLGGLLSVVSFPVAQNLGLMAVSGVLLVSGSTYPDIDAEGSHATKSYGWLSHLLHSLTHLLTQSLYSSTRGERDRGKKGSHRLLTHTALGNLLAGAVLVVLCYIHVWVAAIAVGFLIGMAVAVWKKRWRWQALVGGVLVAYGTYDPRMVWIWGVAFALGNMIHCFGDSCTLSGTPWFWPMERDGKRWGASHALPEWARIRTGTANERVILGLTYFLTLGLLGGILFLKSII